MGRKLVRENEFLQAGGLLSFPRTGCALRASGSYHEGTAVGTAVVPAQCPTGVAPVVQRAFTLLESAILAAGGVVTASACQ